MASTKTGKWPLYGLALTRGYRSGGEGKSGEVAWNARGWSEGGWAMRPGAVERHGMEGVKYWALSC
jgi:hypothetical protein